MKTHGITNTGGGGGGGRSGSPSASGPSTPTTDRKKAVTSRPSTAKKRKLAARGDDLDDDVKSEVKNEVKQEVKHEATKDEVADGSYLINPAGFPLDMTAANASVTMSSGTYPSMNGGEDDEVLLVSEAHRAYGGPMTHMAFVQQMLMPPPPENFYGFVDQPTSDLHLPPPTAVAATSAPFSHEHETDHSPQTRTLSEPPTGHWLHHQNAGFF